MMRRKQGDMNVFSMSALDLFCSAMGVFMVLCFISMPFYLMKGDVAQVVEPEGIDSGALLVSLSWRSAADLDLYVVGPDGLVYCFSTPTHEGSSAALLRDDEGLSAQEQRREVFLAPYPVAGSYRLLVGVYAAEGAMADVEACVSVQGRGFYEEFVVDGASWTLKRPELVADVVIDDVLKIKSLNIK